MAHSKVLICGAGIGGQALAFWLSKMNFDVTVIERSPTLRTTGLQLDLRGPGIEVMKRMGLEEVFRAKSVQEQGLEVVGDSGKRWAYFPANRTGKGLQGFTTDFEIMRGDLCQILHDSSKDRVNFVFGTTIEKFEQKDNTVNVTFSDGKKDQFDLLVGADGQGSRTRRAMLQPGSEDPIHYLGVYIAYFTIPQPLERGEEYNGTVYLSTGRRFVFVRRNEDSKVQVYLAYKTKSDNMKHIHKGDTEKEKEVFVKAFKGARWNTDALLEGMMATDDFYCERLGVVKLNAWSDRRVALVGDAAFCPSASTGMGTTSSMVGAYVLAGEIGKHCGGSGNKESLSSALKSYEEKFRPFMDQVQDGITEDRAFWGKIPSSSIGITIVNLILWLAALLRLDVISKWLLREDVQNWDLPNYDQMVYGAGW
jgi:2-polyprenyl-6-methoxyphenol hydroxylase-like FAD-dependent oxidoreductase